MRFVGPNHFFLTQMSPQTWPRPVQTLSGSNKDHEEQRQNLDLQLTEGKLVLTAKQPTQWRPVSVHTPTHSLIYIVK